jgi:hypothetical protein
MIAKESEIRFWLTNISTEENLDDFSVNILGNAAKGEGYAGDIVFVSLNSAESQKEYHLVLKCSKQNKTFRETTPVKESFTNEIYVYDRVFPVFTQFQLKNQIENPFDSVPNYYGKFMNENIEVLVFDNVKNAGYSLWNKKNSWTRKHINMVVEDYGKFHAVSFAMQDQHPEQFEELSSGLQEVFKMFLKSNGLDGMFILSTWKNFKSQIDYIFYDMCKEPDVKKVIIHGDCWNNNYMFKYAVSLPFIFEICS